MPERPCQFSLALSFCFLVRMPLYLLPYQFWNHSYTIWHPNLTPLGWNALNYQFWTILDGNFRYRYGERSWGMYGISDLIGSWIYVYEKIILWNVIVILTFIFAELISYQVEWILNVFKLRYKKNLVFLWWILSFAEELQRNFFLWW